MDLVSLVSNSDRRLDQNVLRNMLSWSEMMVYGMPKWNHTHSNKSLAISSIVIFFLQAMRTNHLQKLINDQNTQSLP
jgi:hypothetical protein